MSEKELAVYRPIRAHYLGQFLPTTSSTAPSPSCPAASRSWRPPESWVVAQGLAARC